MDQIERDIAGPRNDAVLTLQQKHRSRRVWEEEEFLDAKVFCCRYDAGVESSYEDDRIETNLRTAGFYGVHRVQPIKLDHSLITALLERWRPEVHAFQFPFGELGITLQDVECLLGLPVDGEPIVFTQNVLRETYSQLFLRVLDFPVDDTDFGSLGFNLRRLEGRDPLSEDSIDEEAVQYTTGIILQLIGVPKVKSGQRQWDGGSSTFGTILHVYA
ncbi:unnamed protein product [Cuscuta campestris]|uniref:Aminotransferase-like plant mobile domain-containing protein n=1 Tax=Cuscuta campestris TaxID=132261 RepID=A0A484KMD2_9ASTE|nr:unnamed protein product [Cuscuta campestris]